MEGFLLPTPDNLLTIVLCFDISLSFLSSLRHLYSLSPVPRYTPL